MCAGGLPVPNNIHALNVVNAAMDILKFMQDHLQKSKIDGKEQFEIRIGVHSGPVVAGVVGDKKFAFHVLPSGMLNAKTLNVVGNGVVINLQSLKKELDMLTEKKVDYAGKLVISDRAHLTRELRLIPRCGVIDRIRCAERTGSR